MTEAFEHPSAVREPNDSAAVGSWFAKQVHRKWRHLHRERIGKKPRFPLGRGFLALDEDERSAVPAFLNKERHANNKREQLPRID